MTSIYFRKTFQRSFGTWPLRGQELSGALHAALEAGYRSIDTAQMYGNEAEVGVALAASGIPRADLCITTKVRPDNYTEEAFLPSIEKSLADLKTDHVDVLLLHWPPIGGDIVGPVRLLEKAVHAGYARAIGVSNFTASMMRTAKATIATELVTNQVEFHPLLDQTKLLAAAIETGIPLASYCSVARGKVFSYPLFSELGDAYGKSAAQIVLRWILQKGVSINTMSTKPENIRANFDVMDFTLSSIDMARIDALNATGYRIVTREKSAYAPDYD